MTPQRWQDIKETLAVALGCKTECEREQYLSKRCRDDMELRREVESMLSPDSEIFEEFANLGGFLQPNSLSAANVGRTIGPYRLVRELGRGGMGSVWLAERIDQRFDQRVAIKLLTRADHTRELFERFQSERRVLARLDHPNIARLIDGGETDDGIAFFIMEYVADAESITAFVHRRNLSVRKRVELFRTVCGAIQFAHQNLIVHGDLKPANVLITTSGEPKLVDFGIARLVTTETDSSLPREEMSTARRHLTVAYASPEQREARTITTAADIYSLGIVLHEVLTGQLPPSLDSGASGEPAKLKPELKSIVKRATAPDPRDRYSTATALSEDLRRHLVRRPISAHSSTIAYRAGKFVSRHKVGVAIAIAYTITLLAVAAVAVEQAYRARRRFAEVQRLSHSVLFEIHDAIRDLPGATTARQLIVSRALEYLDRLAGDSRGETALQLDLAAAYLRVGDVQGKPYAPNLGDSFGALSSYQKAIDITAPLAAAESGASSSARAVLSQAYESLGSVQSRVHKPEDAARSHDLSLAIRTALLKSDPAHADQWERSIVANYLGLGSAIVNANRLHPTAESQRAAIENSRRALAVCERLVARNPRSAPDILSLVRACSAMGLGLTDLAAIEHDNAVFDEALSFHRRAIELVEGQLKNDPTSARNQRTLADELIASAYLRAFSGKDLDEGLAECRRANQIIRNQADADPANAEAQQDLSSTYFVEAKLLQAKGDFHHAEQSYRQCLSILEPLVSTHEDNVETQFDLARVHEALKVVSQPQIN